MGLYSLIALSPALELENVRTGGHPLVHGKDSAVGEDQ